MSERSELHCHTKMSTMSGLADVRELIQKAKNVGMQAIAITDFDTVQAFPEAYREWQYALRENDNEDDDVKILLGIETLMVDELDATVSHKIIIFPTSREGMRDLYAMISEVKRESHRSCLKIPKSMLVEKREGLYIGSCAQGGEVSHAVFDDQSDESIRKILDFYDFIEVEPVDNYIWALSQSTKKDNLTVEQVKESIRRVVRIGKEEAVLVVASANVCYLNKGDIEAFKVLRYADGFNDSKGWKAKHHLMSADELMKEFGFLGEETATEIVVNNSNRVASKLGVVQPISPDKQYPVYPDAYLKLNDICYKKAHEIYGDKLPEEVKTRLEFELIGIKRNDFASLYMIAHELVKKSNTAGYLVGGRGCSGASFVSFLAGITETNPLPAHYLCKSCKYTDFDVTRIKGYRRGDLGLDLPNKKCPICGSVLSKEGFDLPVEAFWGLDLDKEPDFDMNFAVEYQHVAQCSVCEIDGVGEICRAGTIGTLSEREAIAYAEKYFKMKNSRRSKESVLKVADKLVGVRLSNGIHPGGIIAVPKGMDISEYTPLVDCGYDDMSQTLIDYHSLDGKLLKIDILGHNALSLLKYLSDETGIDPCDIKFGEDKKVMSLFSSTDELGIEPGDIKGITVGTLGVPEYSLWYGALKMLEHIRPTRFSDIIKTVSMIHGMQVWDKNAETIVKENSKLFSDCIASREDIMLYLMEKGLEREEAYQIMENVRMGKARYGLKEEWISDMRKASVPEWYIRSCRKIGYLFPKAHGAHYFLMSWRMLYYKLYYPEAFYRGWVKYYDTDSLHEKGYEYASTEYDKLSKKDPRRLGWNQLERMDDYLVIIEMHARGIGLVEC